MSRFHVAGGSVTGRSHTLSGRANQDAWHARAEGEHLVAVVADGCGSGAHSEVGAQLGARIAAAALLRRLAEGAALDDGALWEALRDDVLAALRPVALAAGGRLADVVSEMFLFTLVGVAVRGERGCVFAAGDGVAAIDGEVVRLGPFPGDAPPYLGYGLLGREGAPRLAVVRAFDGEARTILVGTDGAAALADLGDGGSFRALWEEERHFRNRDALRRTLALYNREEVRPNWAERRLERRRGSLEDDATVVVLKRQR
jgi:hypothetical protein